MASKDTPLPQRLVVISDSSSPAGGAEIMALSSAELMAQAGIPVTFVTGDAGAECPLDRNLIEVVALGETWNDNAVGPSAVVRALYNPRARRLVQETIARLDGPGTVYHLHNWTKILSPAVFRALEPVSSRLLISAHDFSLVCPNVAYSNFRRGGETCRLKPLSGRCLVTNCDRETYVHKLWRVARSIERRLFIDLGATDALVTVIHPDMAEYFIRGGVAAHRLRMVRNPVRPYSPTRIPAERNSDLFFVGRVVPEKGIDLAAEAARETGRNLRVIGDGPARPGLERRFPEVVFEGWRSHEEISRLIRGARALLVPSRLPETFTLVAHEALRSGIPVVAFADVDCREAAEVGAAITAPPRSAESLAQAIRRLDDDAAVEQISRRAFEHAPRYSNTTESWGQALLGLYGELIGRAASLGEPSMNEGGTPPDQPAAPAQGRVGKLGPRGRSGRGAAVLTTTLAGDR